MDLSSIIENTVVAVTTAGITWFFSRHKQLAEIKSSELDNVEKVISIWRALAQDLAAKVEALSTRCESLSDEIEQLRYENESLKAALKKAIETYQPGN